MFGKLSALLLMIVLVALARPQASPTAGSCKSRSDLVGKCFRVHGRLSVYNGTPSIRLWPVGTRRLLGVIDPTDISGEPGPSTIPRSVEARLEADQNLFGDFLVCPLSRARPGRMQTVCIESGDHLVARNG